MKNLFVLFFSAVLLCSSINVIAWEKPKTEIASVKEKNKMVRFTITSSRPFIYANNKYYLYIGDKDFSSYEQSKKNGKGVITFIIPSQDFNALSEDAGIYLSYGYIEPGRDFGDISKKSNKCWSLGKFSKSILTK